MNNYIVNCKDVPGWANFVAHCDEIYYNSNIVSSITVYDHELKKMFGDRYPRVKVKTPRTYPHYIRFRTEKEYTMFVLRWA